MNENLMELMDREREHGRMLHQEEALCNLINVRIYEALEADLKCDFYHNYKDLDKISVTVGDLAIVTGYAIPDWLMKKAEEVKEAKENG